MNANVTTELMEPKETLSMAEQARSGMKVWVLHDDDQDGNIYGIHGVTSDPAVAKLWETEYERYKADAFELDDMRRIADIFQINGEASPQQ